MSEAKEIEISQHEYGALVDGYPEYPEQWKPVPVQRVVATPKGQPRITNNLNLPMPLVEAVKNDRYSPGKSDYTTSQLAGAPARQWALKGKHWHELSEDVADRIYSLSGQSKHSILERAAEYCEQYHYLAEKRFYVERCGKVIGGQIDLYDSKARTLYDWKEVGVFVSKNALKDEWVAQGNINKLLCDENGYPVEHLINIALYRDWKKSIAQTKKPDEYPQYQVEQFPLPVWAKEETEAFIKRRIEAFESAKSELPLCTAEERWYSDEKYALTKKGNKKATKLFDTEEEAKTHAEIFNLTANHEITHRPGVNKRCESYCIVSAFCEQFKKLKEQENELSGNHKAA
jgi:hypothetical protein